MLVVVSLIISSVVKSYIVNYTGDVSKLMINTPLKNEYKLSIDDNTITYQEYLKKYSSKKVIDSEIKLTLDSSTSNKKDNYLESENGIFTSDKSRITWSLNCPEDGFYSLFLTYKSVVGTEPIIDTQDSSIKDHYRSRTREIQREVLIDDKLPFQEAYQIKFARTWTNKDKISENEDGDQVRPNQIETPFFNDHYVNDFTNKNTHAYKFYLSKGNHTVTFNAITEPIFIKDIKFKKYDIPLKYDEAIENYLSNGYEIYSGNDQVEIQGEDMLYKSSPVLIPLSDTTSSRIYPRYTGKNVKLNIMGYFSWRLAGYWIEYEFNAPKKGLYALSFNAKQDIKEGTFSTREIIINGKVPFLEASYMPFLSSNDFTTYTLGSKNKPYLFPLEKGKNKIRMRTSLSNVGDILNIVKNSIDKLNDLYIETLTSVPEDNDNNNTFNIEMQVVDFKKRIFEISTNLKNMLKHYQKIVKNSQSITASIKTMISQLDRFYAYPNAITKELNFFKSNIAALGSWFNQESEQPLTLDAFYFHNPKKGVKRVKENVFEKINHEFLKFIYSFKANNKRKKNAINVWVTSGRDNAQIIKRLLTDPSQGLENISVNLELVNETTLQRATFSKRQPDVAINVAEGVPLNFAFRNVLTDLSKLDGFNEVKRRYSPSAFTTFTHNQGIYAIPETQIYPVMFYRKDIFKKLGLTFDKVAPSYEELENIIETLQNQKMNFYLESPVKSDTNATNTSTTNVIDTGLFSSFLYQRGGNFYSKDLRKTGLLQESAKQAFIQFCEYFSNRGVDIQANFINRFRSGEMPAGIAQYDVYNQLAVFAPEISGKWAIAPVPTFLSKFIRTYTNQDYTISTNIPQSTILFKDSKNQSSAWEFIKWWTSDKIQLLYGRELETTVGAAARYTAANINTADLIPWPRNDLDIIQLSRTRTKGIPQVPGGYMTTRQFKNAFLANVRDNKGSVDVLYNYAQEIDLEILKKRKEFNLN